MKASLVSQPNNFISQENFFQKNRSILQETIKIGLPVDTGRGTYLILRLLTRQEISRLKRRDSYPPTILIIFSP